MEMLGYRVDAGDLVIELLKDKAYFDKSGGGVTLSGGEPTLQPDFAVALAEGLKRNGISVALDTCGLCSRQTLETLLPLVDLVLYDLKLIDPLEHEKWTGVSNQRILDNLIWLADAIHTRWPEKKLWIRTPLIPGATLTQENIRGIGEFLENLPLETVERWELCAFNNLCRDKYRRLEMEWTFSDTTLITAAELELAGEWAKASGIDSILVSVTGAARVEN
jgi:pyruvate formate lyase activating enzyme